MDYPDRVAAYFKGLMGEWEAEVTTRDKTDEHWLQTLEGKSTQATMRLTKEYISPLFKLLKRRQARVPAAAASPAAGARISCGWGCARALG